MSSDQGQNAPPPSYDEVLAAGPSLFVRGSSRPIPFSITPPPTTMPTVMERQEVRRPQASTLTQPTSSSRNHGNTRLPNSGSSSGVRTQTPSRQTTAHLSSQQRPQRPPLPTVQEQPPGLIDQMAMFSMPTLMLNGVTLPKINVDLDSEAHLPNRRNTVRLAQRRKRIKSFCACYWCWGFTMLFFLIALPIAMILTGVFGINDCPFNDNIIIIALVSLGAFMITTVIVRLVVSGLACCKVANIASSEKSRECSIIIIILEVVFLLFLITYILFMALTSWFVFTTSPNQQSETSKDYCSSGIYTAANAFMGTNLGLGVALVLYLAIGAVFFVLYRDGLVEAPRPKNPRTQFRGNLTTPF